MRIVREPFPGAGDEPLHLLNARVHEIDGWGRTGFALFQAARLRGPIFWIVLAHDRDWPIPGSLSDDVAERLHVVAARNETDLL